VLVIVHRRAQEVDDDRPRLACVRDEEKERERFFGRIIAEKLRPERPRPRVAQIIALAIMITR